MGGPDCRVRRGAAGGQAEAEPLRPEDAGTIDAFVDALWVEDGLAALTLAAYRRDLTLFARWLQREQGPSLATAREADLLGYITERHAATRATTANRRLSVFKRYFRWAAREHLVTADPTLKLQSARQALRVPRTLSEPQVEALLAAPDVDTPLATAFAQRAGVCQDFAHLLIGACRLHGLAARYVSGYLRTEPPAGQPALLGADASHAWVQVWCPGTSGVPADGWLDLDPTNCLVPAADHIRVAVGRDFGDVTPLRGVIRGGGTHTLTVGVTTQPAR